MTHQSENPPYNTDGTAEPIHDATLRDVSRDDEVNLIGSSLTEAGYYFTEEGKNELRRVAELALAIEALQGSSVTEDKTTNH